MKYRVMERPGKCSICYNTIEADDTKVFTVRGLKHKRLVVICTQCAEKIHNIVKKENHNE